MQWTANERTCRKSPCLCTVYKTHFKQWNVLSTIIRAKINSAIACLWRKNKHRQRNALKFYRRVTSWLVEIQSFKNRARMIVASNSLCFLSVIKGMVKKWWSGLKIKRLLDFTPPPSSVISKILKGIPWKCWWSCSILNRTNWSMIWKKPPW